MSRKHVRNLTFGIIIVVTFFGIIFLWRFIQVTNQELNSIIEVQSGQTIFEPIELRSQKDFKLIGDQIYSASGFEPGWALKLSIAGNKFGVDLVSQYGETKYVGYIDLSSQSATTKIWEGKVLDIQDKIQNIQIQILNKKCIEPSGDEVDYAVKVKVGNEDISGCAKLTI